MGVRAVAAWVSKVCIWVTVSALHIDPIYRAHFAGRLPIRQPRAPARCAGPPGEPDPRTGTQRATGGGGTGTPLPSLAMSFRPEATRGANGAGGVVDYRLTRQAVVRDYRKGRLSRLDVCDAHPELQRAASGAGTPTDEPCPICEEESLALVTYAFGPRLPAGGRCVTTAREMAELARGRVQVACYVVEVCPGCAWNHLTRVFHVGGA